MAYHTSLDIHSIEAVTIANSVVQSGECVTKERIKGVVVVVFVRLRRKHGI